MKSLFLLIALYTISGKQAVPSGDVPAGSSCTYEQSGSKSGQLTAGNELLLILSGYEGTQLQSVTLTMRSNTSSGAGQMNLAVGETVVWSIADAPFSNGKWAGAYSTEWQELSHSLSGLTVPQDEPITLHIQASQNSLYLQSVAVEYAGEQAEAYTVSFNTHTPQHLSPLTEAEPDAGVFLPELTLTDDEWRFYGWLEMPVDETMEMPSVFFAGSTYHPADDCTLHAVFVKSGERQPWYPADDLTKGDYLITFYDPQISQIWMANGAVENSMLATQTRKVDADNGWVALPHDMCSDNAVYTLQVTNDTLVIKHKTSGSPVALGSGGKFIKTSSSNVWRVSPSDAEGVMPAFDISGIAGSKLYYISYYAGLDAQVYFRPTSDAQQRHDLLLYALNDREATAALYSSYPFGDGLPANTADAVPAYSVQIGPCVMTIINGKKYLHINE